MCSVYDIVHVPQWSVDACGQFSGKTLFFFLPQTDLYASYLNSLPLALYIRLSEYGNRDVT